MAGRHDDKGSDKGRVKVRVIEFEMEGSNQTLRESIRDIVGAIGRGQVQARAPVALAAGKVAMESSANGLDVEDEVPEVLEADEFEEDAVESRTSNKPRRFRSPKIVTVDLRGGDVPLKQFLSAANPESDQKRYTLIAYWFKAQRDTPDISADHIYTAYKEMGWTTIPKDVGSPLRVLKAEGLLESGSTRGTYKLNHIGEGKAEDFINKARGAG